MDRSWNGIPLPTGVEVATDGERDPVVRVRLTYKGVECREPIGPASKVNIRIAADKIAAVRLALRTATREHPFNYGSHFPDSERCKLFGEHSADGVLFGPIQREYFAKFTQSLRRITRTYYEKTADLYVYPKWEKTPVSQITATALEDWFLELAQSGIVLKSARNIIIPMRNAWQRVAIPRYKIKENPFKLVSLFALWPEDKRDTDYDPDPFNDDERAAILKVAPEQWRNQFQAWCWLGLRPQEIAALKWSEVDFVNGLVRVRRVLSMERIEERTKTKAGMRDVPMHPNARAALMAQKKFTLTREDGFVFVNPVTGKPWAAVRSMSNFQWPTMLKRAGVRQRGPGQCRHTFASIMFDNGENVADVSKWMGHKNIKVTMEKYIRMIECANRRGSNAFRGDYSKVAI